LAAVFEIAPAKVLQGAVRLQGLASSPTPDTQVRVACAFASDADKTQNTNPAKALGTSLVSLINFLLRVRSQEQRMYRRGNGSEKPNHSLKGVRRCRELEIFDGFCQLLIAEGTTEACAIKIVSRRHPIQCVWR